MFIGLYRAANASMPLFGAVHTVSNFFRSLQCMSSWIVCAIVGPCELIIRLYQLTSGRIRQLFSRHRK